MSGAAGSPGPPTQPIRSLLVANRGEIAWRVFRTAREMGLRCVAVFADADADAPFVHAADAAVRLDSGYLDGPAIVEAALSTGADALHPGYGFLSENAEFARSVIDAGLTWVGPAPDVIATMGDKIAAKRLADEAGVPTLGTWDVHEQLSADIAYPLLVKAAAGGGGKGMRVVRAPGDLEESVAAARREALSGFGDDRVFVERFLQRSRHVEIQILGDSHGSLVHLGERECSIQRRHQKIIEEAPSPAVDEVLRSEMGGAALAVAGAIGYTSAGTVEFLLDDETGEFWFLEVNTRLQVEHPVTELVSGIDLVREQLRIAAGEPLGYDTKALTRSGHAIEARLYAEDPDNGFLPATGRLDAYRPAEAPAVRWDSGVAAGSVIGIDFDPMIAKVAAHAATRSEAARRLAAALERLHIGGVVTNRSFLAATLRHPAFLAGDTTTDFIERHSPQSSAGDAQRAAITAAMALRLRNRARDDSWGFAPSNWRNAVLPPERVTLLADGDDAPVTVAYLARRDGSFGCAVVCGDDAHLSPDGADWGLDASDGGSSVSIRSSAAKADGSVVVGIEIDGVATDTAVTVAGDRVHVQTDCGTLSFTVQPRFSPPAAAASHGGLAAPMPATVSEIRCSPGDAVRAGEILAVIEAMKMEHHIRAPFDGTVTGTPVAPGDQVELGAILVVIDPAEAPAGSPAAETGPAG